MITEISIDKISPHPKNPRKSLGDEKEMRELADSIRAFGVLQNLTVVPNDEEWDTFTVICGHRRLAAAKEAGLSKVPCSISEMDEKTQLSLMLMENMQRSDLTLLEEAQGFQMMLDLGISMREITEKTGLSYTKVRHRVKLNELDQELLAEKAKGEISINDLIKLEKLKDPKHKRQALEKIGTNNFDWEVGNLFKEECKEYVRDRLEKLLPEAEFTQNWSAYTEVCGLKYVEATDAKLAEFAKDLRRCAEEQGAGMMVQIGWDAAAGKVKVEPKREQTSGMDPEYAARIRRQKERIDGLESMREKITDRITQFIRAMSDEKAQKAMDEILPYATLALTNCYGSGADASEVLEALGREVEMPKNSKSYSEKCDVWEKEFAEAAKEELHKTFLAATVWQVIGNMDDLWGYDGKYHDSYSFAKDLIKMYGVLGRIGYEAADEELDFIHGKSDLYLKEEEE